jgi:hypothetical protein
MATKTKQDYEEYLNGIHPTYESEEWIIGGKSRHRMYPNYGKALRLHDPIGFEIGFREWNGR